MRIPGIGLPLGAVLMAIAAAAPAAEFNPVAREPRLASSSTSLGVIVQLRRDGAAAPLSTGRERVAALGKRAGLSMTLRREISDAMLAGTVDLAGADAHVALERLRADPAVAFAVPDRRRYAHATNPNDALFTNQWYLQNTQVSAVNAINAWDNEQGSSGVVVAVLDTGVLYDHPDLGRADRGGKLLPGYDFVNATLNANDGDGRDADPSDPGDWVTAADKTIAALANCSEESSSWHGTRVAGMIGALTNNGSGVAGLDWHSYILPVRVLGKCGGLDSDIIAGMRWAAGLPVIGAPVNPTPARVLNMSLGSTGPCEASYRAVIEDLTERKVLVVISAGNEGTVVSSPANCEGVAAVAALRHAGSKVGFSNLGPEVTLGAPGGNCVNVNGGPCLFSLDTTSNAGTTVPTTHSFTGQQDINVGTSFSAPIVSGIAGLMLSRNFNLSTAQLLERLRQSSRPFPASIDETPQPCASEHRRPAARAMSVHGRGLRRRHGRRGGRGGGGGPADRRHCLADQRFRRPVGGVERRRQRRGLWSHSGKLFLDGRRAELQPARDRRREYRHRDGARARERVRDPAAHRDR
jgi:serine protease